MIEVTEQEHTLACLEVWGSNRNIIRTVELPELPAWVYSKPAEAEHGGDVHYLSVCGQSVLSRVVLADVSGHGAQVSKSAQVLQRLMREHINTWDQTEFVRELNKAFRHSVTSGKFATAVIFGIIRGSGETTFTSAGHLPPLWYRANRKTWEWLDHEACNNRECGLDGLPVGLIEGTRYRQTLLQLEPDDMLVLYTDGITEAQDGFGDMLGRDRLMAWTCMAPVDDAASTGQSLLMRLNEFRRDNFTDDETLIVIQKR